MNHAVRKLDNMAVKHRIAKVVIDPTADMAGEDTNTALGLIAGERWQCTNLTRSGFCRLCTTVKEVHEQHLQGAQHSSPGAESGETDSAAEKVVIYTDPDEQCEALILLAKELVIGADSKEPSEAEGEESQPQRSAGPDNEGPSGTDMLYDLADIQTHAIISFHSLTNMMIMWMKKTLAHRSKSIEEAAECLQGDAIILAISVEHFAGFPPEQRCGLRSRLA